MMKGLTFCTRKQKDYVAVASLWCLYLFFYAETDKIEQKKKKRLVTDRNKTEQVQTPMHIKPINHFVAVSGFSIFYVYSLFSIQRNRVMVLPITHIQEFLLINPKLSVLFDKTKIRMAGLSGRHAFTLMPPGETINCVCRVLAYINRTDLKP